MSGSDQGPEDPRDGLAAVLALRQLADRLEATEVERAVRSGWTWGRIAEALGVTRQAVHKKYAKRVAATRPTNEPKNRPKNRPRNREES